MNRFRLLAFGLVVLVLLGTGLPFSRAQTGGQPLVVIIEGSRPFDSAAMTNIGPSGISQLAGIFRAQGARVQFDRLESPLPSDADVVVLVRPMRSLKLPQVGYLWAHLARGNNLLLAIDPENFFLGTKNVKPRYNRSGLAKLIEADFGLKVFDTFLAEPWSSIETIQSLDTTYGLAFADVVSEPIAAPLRRFDLPVWVWGARHMTVEPLGLGSEAAPLLYTDTAYGETGEDLFRTRSNEAIGHLEFEAYLDARGRLNIGAQAISTNTGARIVLLGDSELLQNGYGLARDGLSPRYPGNRILAERIAAWLLGSPPEAWPALPRGFTWLAVDGKGDDWAARSVTSVFDAVDAEVASPDLQVASAFADDLYVYLLVRTRMRPDSAVEIKLALDTNRDGRADRQIKVTTRETISVSETGEAFFVPDARMAVGDVIELRLPRRVFGVDLAFSEVCIELPGAPGSEDCLGQVLRALLALTNAPFDYMLDDQLLVTVYTSGGIYMRSGPSRNFAVIATLGNGDSLAAIGRSADGEWIQVQNARYTGWIAAFLLAPNGDLSLLPVVSSQ